jgi:hypothetical protein
MKYKEKPSLYRLELQARVRKYQRLVKEDGTIQTPTRVIGCSLGYYFRDVLGVYRVSFEQKLVTMFGEEYRSVKTHPVVSVYNGPSYYTLSNAKGTYTIVRKELLFQEHYQQLLRKEKNREQAFLDVGLSQIGKPARWMYRRYKKDVDVEIDGKSYVVRANKHKTWILSYGKKVGYMDVNGDAVWIVAQN